MSKYLKYLICISLIYLSACKCENKKSEQKTVIQTEVINLSIDNPKTFYSFGDTVRVNIKYNTIKPDSILFTSENSKIILTKEIKEKYLINTKKLGVGFHSITANVFSGSSVYKSGVSVNILSDIEPGRIIAKKIKTYPHDIDAYTQGLLIYNGQLYEGTGGWGKSNLRSVDLNSGKVLKQVDIDEQHFGEGIAIIKDKIYQITWKSQLGFIYDRNTFRKIGEFTYSTEGWGLTSKGDTLLMSDGTEHIYFIDPNGFKRIKSIQVYNNKGKVPELNELEYIKGFIYANIYRSDLIVKIEPSTGRVVDIIKIYEFLQQSDLHAAIDVLNGIAYDKEKDKIYVTGKNWPKLFEVEF